MSDRKNALKICNGALFELVEELKKGNSFANREQLLQFKAQLENIIQQLESNTLPPKNKRLVWISRVIVDSWPLDSRLGNVLCSAEQAYCCVE